MPLELDGRYGFVPLSLIEGSRLAVIRGEAIMGACNLFPWQLSAYFKAFGERNKMAVYKAVYSSI